MNNIFKLLKLVAHKTEIAYVPQTHVFVKKLLLTAPPEAVRCYVPLLPLLSFYPDLNKNPDLFLQWFYHLVLLSEINKQTTKSAIIKYCMFSES